MSAHFAPPHTRARPDEAISWGKIRMDAQPVKVYGEASILFPLVVAQTFAKRFHAEKEKKKEEEEEGEEEKTE